jgi:LPS O-antigen subunit length determinant protein (WzzB/FepE family)
MRAVSFRLPFDAPLPPSGPRRWAVLAMLVVGGLVALLVPVVFAIVLLSMMRGG